MSAGIVTDWLFSRPAQKSSGLLCSLRGILLRTREPRGRNTNHGIVTPLPQDTTSIRDVAHLEELLSAPTEAVIHAIGQLEGDIIVLGVGGKMGPSLAAMAKRASVAANNKRRVIGVARFSSPK